MINKKNKPEDFFAIAHLRKNLKDRVINSTAITVSVQIFKLILQLTFIALLARLLQPEDFGLLAMVSVFTGLGLQLMEGGLSMATIQREKITHAQVSNLFWLNIALGFAITFFAILISPLIALLYGESELRLIMIMMSFTFLIESFSVQHNAILRRQMRFKEISVIDIISMLIGGIFGITAAFIGYGYWSLVIMPVTSSLIKTLLTWLFISWRPSFFKKNSGTKPLIYFGANVAGAGFMTYFTVNTTPFALGIIGGPHFLGLYDRAFKLASIPSKRLLPPIATVLQTAIVKVANEPERLKRVSLSLMAKIVIVTVLVLNIMFVSADWIVLLLLGDAWIDVIPIFQLLAIGLVATPINILITMILVAVGQAKPLLHWKIITFIISLIFILLGSIWGFWGILWSATLGTLLIRIPLFFIYAAKFQPVKALEFIMVLIIPIIITIFIITTMEFLKQYYAPENFFIAVFLYLVVIPFIYTMLCLSFKITRQELFEIFDIIKKILNKKLLKRPKLSQ